MSRNKEDQGLSNRDRELVALGAAVASNCIPCVEYHIPQARKAGLGDIEIDEAVALADKVRRVPAEKVLQTASALIERQSRVRVEGGGDACGCSDQASQTKGSKDSTTPEPEEPHANHLRLDNESSVEDNRKDDECCGNGAKDSTGGRGSDEVGAGARSNTPRTGLDFSKMMEMMRGCCPDKMKDFSSMMSDFEKRFCSPNENAGSGEPD